MTDIISSAEWADRMLDGIDWGEAHTQAAYIAREIENAAYERAAVIAEDDHLYGDCAKKIRALKHGGN